MMSSNASSHDLFLHLDPFSSEGMLHTIIDTPKNSRNKYKYAPEHGLFMLGGILPAGAVFPFDFGYVPSTTADDGDPLDVLVLMDEPAFVGCLVTARLIGVIRAEQMEGEETQRNDRLIAVAATSRNHRDVQDLSQINENLLNEIEHFFVSYNEVKGKQFKTEGRLGPEDAKRIVDEGVTRFQKKKSGSK